MEATPTLNVEKPEDAASHVRNVCLGTPVILRELLQQFSNNELAKLSLVNKQWNYEARSVLRDRGSVIVKTKSSPKDLAAFASVLSQMHLVPFAGMSIQLDHDSYCNSTGKGPLDPPYYDVILKRLPFKKLSVDFNDNRGTCTDCPAFGLVKKILEDCGGALEELVLIISWSVLEVLQQFLLLSCSFPRLKTLKLELDDAEDDPNFTKFVKSLVSRLPNLQDLHVQGEIHFHENVLEGSSAVIVPNSMLFNPLYEIVCDSVVPAVRPKLIEIKRYEVEDFNTEVLNRFMPMMLQASRMTLTTLRMDLLFAVPLMCYGVCLENVTELEIYLDCRLLERLSPGLLALVKGFDFTRVLPKLSQVKIDNRNHSGSPFSPAQIRAFVERGKAVLRKALPDRAINIKHLKFNDSVSDSTVPFLAQMFPHVKILSVSLWYDPRVPFTLVWEHYKYLEELEVVHNSLERSVGNLDSTFCGILPEEVAELRKEDDDFLKAVNIVPVMPSIMCLKDLKKFTIRHRPRADKLKKGDANFIFSKVTGLICFARCPDLAVAFESNCAKGLRHMKPYGTLEVNIQMDEDDLLFYNL